MRFSNCSWLLCSPAHSDWHRFQSDGIPRSIFLRTLSGWLCSSLWFQPLPMYWWRKYKSSECLTGVSNHQFSHSVVSNSLRSHRWQHTRPPCPSPTPRVYLNSCPLSWWYHPNISSPVILFSHLQSSPASGSFQMSQFFASGGQTTGVSASASVLPMYTEDWFPLGWTGWISLLSKGFSRVFPNTTVQKHQFFAAQLSL